MPIKELSEITDYKAYQKILKRDLEQAKFKAQPFLYVESFKFTGGKVGPALLVGKVEQSLGLQFKANGTATTLARGRCRFVKDTATFVVDDGVLPPQKLATAVAFGKQQIKSAVSEGLVETRAEDVTALLAAVNKAAKAQLITLTSAIIQRYNAAKTAGLTKEKQNEILPLYRTAQAAAKDDPLTAYDPLAAFEAALALAEVTVNIVADREAVTPDKATKDAFAAYAEAAEAANRQVDAKLPKELPKPGKLRLDAFNVGATHVVKDDLGNEEVVTQRSVKQALEDRVEADTFRKKQVDEHKLGSEKLAAVKKLVTTRRNELTIALDAPKKAIDASNLRIEALGKTLVKKRKEADSLQTDTIDSYGDDRQAILDKENLTEEARQVRLKGLEEARDEAVVAVRGLDDDIVQIRADVLLEQQAVEAQTQIALDAITVARQALKDDIEDAFPGFGKQFPAVVPKLEEVLAAMEKGLPDADKAVRDFGVLANRHGTGRHGAQTGLENQARRVATGGSTADQSQNEWGTSRGLSTRWNAVTIEWEDRLGKKVIKDRKAVLKEVLRQKEIRVSKASASSSFHSPELEMEAVKRGVDIATNQILWTEESTDGVTWAPLERIALTISAPRVNRAVGWGLSQKQKDDARKITLEEANAVLDRFRNGEIGVDEMLDELNSALVRDAEGGAKMMRAAKLILDRTSTGWVSTTHYPCDDAPGWSLTGKKVRVDENSPTVDAPDVDKP